MPLIAETERLHVCSWSPDDVIKLYNLTREPGLSQFSLSGYEDFTMAQAKTWIQSEMLRFEKYSVSRFGIYLKATEELIGISGLFEQPYPNQKEVELNYRYPIRRRGNGYALEAAKAVIDYGFSKLNLPHIHANADLTNTQSHKILNRLGMKRVGDIEYKGVRAGRWRIENPGRYNY